MENEISQGFKDFSEFGEDFDEQKSSYGLDGLLWLMLGFGLVLGFVWGIASLFKR